MSDIPGRSKNNAPTTEKQQKRAHHAESKGLNGASQAQGGQRTKTAQSASSPSNVIPKGLVQQRVQSIESHNFSLESRYESDQKRHAKQGITPETQEKRAAAGEPAELTDQFFGQNPMLRGTEKCALPTTGLKQGQKLFHSTAEDWHINAIKGGIDPNVGLDEGRFKRGFYVTSHEETGSAELGNTRRSPVNIIEFESTGGGKFADVDKFGPSARGFGVQERDNAFTNEYNKGVAEWTKSRDGDASISKNSLSAQGKAAWVSAQDPGEGDLAGLAAQSKRSEVASKNFIFQDKVSVDPLLGVDPRDPSALNVKGPVLLEEGKTAKRRNALAPTEEVLESGRSKVLASDGKDIRRQAHAAIVPHPKDETKAVDYHRPLAGASAEHLPRHPSEQKKMQRYNAYFDQAKLKAPHKKGSIRAKTVEAGRDKT